MKLIEATNSTSLCTSTSAIVPIVLWAVQFVRRGGSWHEVGGFSVSRALVPFGLCSNVALHA